MKKILYKYLSVTLLLCPLQFFSQNIVWSSVMGGQREEMGNSICLDLTGNVITTGSFEDICYSNSNSSALISAGFQDIYVQKLSPTGTILWTNQYGGSNSDIGHSVITDSEGNIFVAGTFLGTVNFGNATLSSSINQANFFVLKLDTNGTIIWRKSIPGSLGHRPKLAIDLNNNLLLTGIFGGTRIFGNSSLNSNNGIGHITKLNGNNGQVLWTTQYGSGTTLNGDAVPFTVSSNVTTDTLGNVYVAGCFRGHGRFGSQNVLIQNSDYNGYIMKISSLGSIVWTKFYTGQTQCTTIVSDSNNNIYLAGNYFGTTTINNSSYTAPSGFYSIFLQKMDGEGNLLWFKNYDIKEPNHYDAIPILAIDNFSNLFFSCRFGNFSATETITFENQTFRDIVSTQPNNILKPQLLASYDSNGTNLWVKQYETLSDNFQFGSFADKTTNIAVNQLGLFFTSGSSTFNNIIYSGESGKNIFTAKLNLPYTLNLPIFDNNNGSINLFPNPTNGKINLSLSEYYAKIEITIFNSIGQKVNSFNYYNTDKIWLDLEIKPGTFVLEINLDGKKTIKKIIKL